MLDELVLEYNKLQKKYGDPSFDSITFGGCKNNPDICFVFMNPTARNITASKEWTGIKSPWVGTKNIWDLFYWTNLLEKVRIRTPIESMNIILNGWAMYQTISSRLYGRSGFYQSVYFFISF